ncbi:hypothetical protein [Anaeromicropila populeti]|uniref:GyrI-like small molecule binding domain-containing protein n=1 Tax=Anaeromicropila populeti TaxID=37658 RepID=A0A1I6JPX8_9FIRM|nr:hypothetical protein [Anaeromicropila populeti]SFR80971.1 hypothetical protein SAMN05661086_01851 [Anaeromicropila populeti]
MHNILIEEGYNLFFENVVVYRARLKQEDFQDAIQNVMTQIFNSGAKLEGKMMTVSHDSNWEDGQLVVDIEYILPIDKKIELTGKYKVINGYKFEKFILWKYCGSQDEFQSALCKFNQYLVEEKISPSTPMHIAYDTNMIEGKLFKEIKVEAIIGIK